MTKREQVYPDIKRLREDEGLTWREVGERIGISPKTAWLEIAEWDWTRLGNGDVLHAVGSLTNGATVDEDWYGEGETACGRKGPMRIPGVISRLGAKRCQRCCKVRRLSAGTGSPKNDERCRPIVKARIEAEAAIARAFEDAVF